MTVPDSLMPDIISPTGAEDLNAGPPTPVSSSRKVKELLGDAFAFVRSAELNKAISSITIEELMDDQIKRNGETAAVSKYGFNPYSYDPAAPPPEGVLPEGPANFLSGADTRRATKLEAMTALHNEIILLVDEMLRTPVQQLVDTDDYLEILSDATPEE